MLHALPLLAVIAAASPIPSSSPSSANALPGVQALRLAQDAPLEAPDTLAEEPPAPDAPAVDAPAVDAPAVDAPAVEAPAVEAPAGEAPAGDAPPAPVEEPGEPAPVAPEGADGSAATPPATGGPPGDAFVGSLAMYGVGLTANCVALGCSLIPIVNYASPCLYCIALPALGGAGQALVGDALGTSRGALLWPMLAMVATNSLTYVASIGATIGVLAASGVLGTVLSGRLTDPNALATALLGSVGAAVVIPTAIFFLGTCASPAVGMLAYSLTAEEKQPGDTEFRLPGFLSPSLPPDAMTAELSLPSTPKLARAEQAMAF